MKYILACCIWSISFTILAQSSSDQLQTIIQQFQDHEGYDWEAYPMGLFTRSYFEEEAAFAKAQLTKLKAIPSDELSETETISLELLQFRLQETVDYSAFEAYLNPLLSDSGFHSSWTYMVRPLSNHAQVINYLNKLNALPEVVDQYLPLLREGLEKGVSQPRIIFEGYASTYDDHIIDDYANSFYYSPFKNLPNLLSTAQRDSVLQAAQSAIENKVTPSFKRIKKFFEEEYLPQTRKTIGVSETPNGNAYYQNRIKYYTTLDLTADEIHENGLQEVDRIKNEMMHNYLDFLKPYHVNLMALLQCPMPLHLSIREDVTSGPVKTVLSQDITG